MLFLISLGLTVLGLVASWGVARRRGAATGMRGAALSLIPMAAYMTGVTEFVTDLVFSPVKWAGVVLAGLAALLYVTSGVMLARRSGGGEDAGPAPVRERGERPARRPKGEIEKAPPVAADPDLADIEAILRRRGIS